MPFPSPSRAAAGPRRRSLLASAAGGALLVGCSAGGLVGCSAGGDDSGGAGSGPSLADRVRAGAARDSQGLVRRYDAVLAAHPALAERLRPLRAEVVRHVAAFGGAGPESPTASSTASSPAGTAPPAPSGTEGTEAAAAAEGSEGPSATPAAPSAVPARPKDALAGLAAAERSLADRRTAALLEVPGELARLLASVAAAGAAHAYLLTNEDDGDRDK
ncbi:hypothetical protein [Streptomyces sp. MK7]|uniref:hypothetical protein n=1 Tax=Streptomyces sp. MK7 TaxID=3067635 RepID=UPI00293097C4|nr:hypothetical protein [Streptomyces sp. MK7]